MSKTTKNVDAITRRLLMFAQILTLLAFALGLNFVIHTTGGSLFLFASISPLLIVGSILIFVGVAIYRFRESHNLFDIETYAPGETIFTEGEVGTCAYFVHKGEVEVLRNENGHPKVIAKLGQDSYFGEMALLSNAPRNATIRAATETQVASLGKHNFLKLLNVLPATKEDVLKTVQARAKEQAARQ